MGNYQCSIEMYIQICVSLVSSVLRNVAHDSCLCENVLDRGSVILRINFIFLECMSANIALWFLIPEENAMEMTESNAY